MSKRGFTKRSYDGRLDYQFEFNEEVSYTSNIFEINKEAAYVLLYWKRNQILCLWNFVVRLIAEYVFK